MKLKKLVIIIVTIAIIFTFSGCALGDLFSKEAGNGKMSLGSWNETTYTNEKFGLTVTVPSDWYILSDEELEQMTEYANEELEDIEFEMEDGEFVPLLLVMNNLDSNLATMNIYLIAARSLLKPNYESEFNDDRVNAMKTQLEKLGEVEINIAGNIGFANTEAHLVEIATKISGTDMIQYHRSYQVYKKGCLLTFTITSIDESAIDDAIKYVTFE